MFILYGKVIYRFSQGQKRSSSGNWLAEKKFSKPAITWFYDWSAENLKKTVTSISNTPEQAIKSWDIGLGMPYFDSFQLIMTWMSKIELNTICICFGFTASKTFHIR